MYFVLFKSKGHGRALGLKAGRLLGRFLTFRLTLFGGRKEREKNDFVSMVRSGTLRAPMDGCCVSSLTTISHEPLVTRGRVLINENTGLLK